jgi:hypothetical protein
MGLSQKKRAPPPDKSSGGARAKKLGVMDHKGVISEGKMAING